jgi:peptidoglycan hydrolase-like protein with peptidoglycan-binding domain
MMATTYKITASVGKDGTNKPQDVILIQVFLNQVAPDNGGADPDLKVDGLMGPSTQAAIDEFQRHHQLGSDGRIDPNGRVLAKINELIAASVILPTTPPPPLLGFTPPGESPAHAVIMGIWGRGGAGDEAHPGNGIAFWLNEFTPQLTALGVPADHIVSISWNPIQNDIPFAVPDTNFHLGVLQNIEPNPSYLALIGHSYGGRSVCVLSNRLRAQPDYVALLDPVFGPFGDIDRTIVPRGKRIDNWFQRNAIHFITEEEECSGFPTGCLLGVSCGREIDNANNQQVFFQRGRAGDPLKRPCPDNGEANRLITHTNIDSDEFIWGQIIQNILSDIENLKEA